MELSSSPCALICFRAFSLFMERVDVRAWTKTNLFLLETKALAVETAPSMAPALLSNSQRLSALMLLPS